MQLDFRPLPLHRNWHEHEEKDMDEASKAQPDIRQLLLPFPPFRALVWFQREWYGSDGPVTGYPAAAASFPSF
jgi:hypothetical protein